MTLAKLLWLLAFAAVRAQNKCTPAELCPSGKPPFSADVIGYHLCESASASGTYTGNTLNPAGGGHLTKTACESAGNKWTPISCGQVTVNLGPTTTCATMVTAFGNISPADPCCVYAPPTPPPSPPPLSPPASDDLNMGLIGGIVGGCFVSVLMLILWLSGAFTKYGWPSPCAKKKAAADGATV